MEIPQAKHGYARDSIEQSKLVNPPWRSKELKQGGCGGSKVQKKTYQNPSHWSTGAAAQWEVQDIQMDW